MKTTIRIFSASAIALLLSGCLTFGSIENRGTSINIGVGAMQNRAILLNLVRASRAEPLYFLSINQVQAQGAADLKVGAPTFSEGPGLSNAARAIGFNPSGSTYLDNSTNTNFQVGVYNTQAFYSGMLAPLGLTEVDLLLHQGFSRELIFYLVIDKAKLTNAQTGKSFIVYNDPTNKASYGLFVQAIKAAMVHGLTTEVPNPLEHAEAGEAGSNGPPSAQVAVKTPPPPAPVLCFEQALATDDAKQEFADRLKAGKHDTFCGAERPARLQSQLTVQLFNEDYQVEVTTRSIYGIFNYLGRVMAHPDLTPQLVDYGVPSETTPAGPLLTIDSGEGFSASCFTAVTYADTNYCVPQQDSQVTKNIFNVLTVLVALKQSPGDLPASQTVLIAP